MHDNAEDVLGRRVQLVKVLGLERVHGPYDPWQCPYVDTEVVDVFGEKFEGEVGMRVVNNGLLADLRAVELSCAHGRDERVGEAQKFAIRRRRGTETRSRL